MNSKEKRIIILGGCGFLGLVTANLLSKNNYQVIIVDLNKNKKDCPKNIDFVGINLLKNKITDFISINSQDIIVNLASRQYSNGIPYFDRQRWFDELNYKVSTELMITAIEKKILGYIFFSSDMAYGLKNDYPIEESEELNPIAEYGKSKMKAEKTLRDISLNKIPLTIFRPRLISGPGRLGLFKNLFKLLKNSMPVPLIGNGKNFYQMVSVFDCAEAIKFAIEKNIPDETFNLASEKKIEVKKLINNLKIFAKSKSKIIPIKSFYIKPTLALLDFLGKPMLYKEQYMIADKNIILNISKVKKILNWQPQYDDQQMINSSYIYWLENYY